MPSNSVKVSVTKESPADRVGLVLMQHEAEDTILIKTVAPTSPFADTKLRQGMQVKSINNVPAEFLSLSQAMKAYEKSQAYGDLEAPEIIVVPENRVGLSPTNPEYRRAIDVASHSAPPPVVSAEPFAYPVATGTSILPMDDEMGPPPSSHVVIASVVKPTVDSMVGVTLVQQRNIGILVSKISPGSMFVDTDLQVGMKVLAINDTDCTKGMSNGVAGAILRSCVGKVTIRAIFPDLEPESQKLGVVTATIYKTTKQTKTGLSVVDRSYPEVQRTVPVVANIASDGLCANTPLRKEQRILSINGLSCRGQSDTVAMLRMAEGSVIIMAGPVDVVSVTVTKSDRGANAGLNLEQDIDGKLRIGFLPNDGLFAPTDLKEGMQILQVNGMEVNQLQPGDVRSILDQLEGDVTILALDDRQKTEKTTPQKQSVATSSSHPSTPQTVNSCSTSESSEPPPDAAPGGNWGTGRYFGPSNGLLYCIICALFGVFGLCTLCCFIDMQVLYRAPDGKVYDEHGQFRGMEHETKFRYNPAGVTGPQKRADSGPDCCGPSTARVLVGVGTGIWVLWVFLVFISR